jgi:preprotein translocase subunit SecG
MDMLKTVFTAIQLVAALGLLGVVMSQATKSEGLTGTIGGKAESAFRGKPGGEDRLHSITKWTAIAFIVSSAILGYIHSTAG